MTGTVLIDDRSALHVIPRAEVRHAEVAALGNDGWALKYQLVGTVVVRSIEWKGESRPLSLKGKIEIGAYNQAAAQSMMTMVTRGLDDLHLERRSDNVFLVRSGLIENDARVVLCRDFIAKTAVALLYAAEATQDGLLRQKALLRQMYEAAHDLTLPENFTAVNE
jgi:hypothetical protein